MRNARRPCVIWLATVLRCTLPSPPPPPPSLPPLLPPPGSSSDTPAPAPGSASASSLLHTPHSTGYTWWWIVGKEWAYLVAGAQAPQAAGSRQAALTTPASACCNGLPGPPARGAHLIVAGSRSLVCARKASHSSRSTSGRAGSIPKAATRARACRCRAGKQAAQSSAAHAGLQMEANASAADCGSTSRSKAHMHLWPGAWTASPCSNAP